MFCIRPIVTGAVATFPVVLAVPALTPSGTVISATVTVGSLTPDSNSTNNPPLQPLPSAQPVRLI